MTGRILDIDPLSGAVERFHFDESADTFTIQRTEDVGAVLDSNRELANHTDGWNADRTMRHAARIPLTIVEEWRQKHGIDIFNPNHAEGVKRLLNSSDYRYLRTQEFVI
jgi:hypothetical protein